MYFSGKSLPRAGKLFQPYYMDIKTCIEYFFLIFNVVLLYQLLFNSHSSPIHLLFNANYYRNYIENKK